MCSPKGAISLHVRTGMVRWQFQHRRQSRKLLLPVGKLRAIYLAFKPLPLPVGIVHILNRQFRERRWLTLCKSPVQRRKLAMKYSYRPAIGNDVMDRDQEDMFVVFQP